MQKDVPIIFQLYNQLGDSMDFWMPCMKRIYTENDKRIDVKVNSQWHENVIPQEFHFKIYDRKNCTILIKPHNDEYSAGWANWFNWRGGYMEWNNRNSLLKNVLSDPDYAHLKSETEIGDDFRMGQYSGCVNLECAPPEDLDGEFKEIGAYFRAEQYQGCHSLRAKPKETLPSGIKKIAHGFRAGQFSSEYFPDYFNPYQNEQPEFWWILLKYNSSLLEKVKAENLTEEICKIAVEIDCFSLRFIPEELKSEEICETAVRKDNHTFAYVPKELKKKIKQKLKHEC